jgi:hypothetical protein
VDIVLALAGFAVLVPLWILTARRRPALAAVSETESDAAA